MLPSCHVKPALFGWFSFNCSAFILAFDVTIDGEGLTKSAIDDTLRAYKNTHADYIHPAPSAHDPDCQDFFLLDLAWSEELRQENEVGASRPSRPVHAQTHQW